MKMRKVRLKTWGFDTPYLRKGKYVLSGIAYGHPVISDGTMILTDELKMIDFVSKTAITKDTEYVLED